MTASISASTLNLSGASRPSSSRRCLVSRGTVRKSGDLSSGGPTGSHSSFHVSLPFRGDSEWNLQSSCIGALLSIGRREEAYVRPPTRAGHRLSANEATFREGTTTERRDLPVPGLRAWDATGA